MRSPSTIVGFIDPEGTTFQSAIAELQESLDYLRLSVKYLVFDLEATRRENAYLRRLVEQSNRRDRGKGGWDGSFYDPDEED